MYVSGVPLASLGLRAFCVAGAWLFALQGAWCTSLASLITYTHTHTLTLTHITHTHSHSHTSLTHTHTHSNTLTHTHSHHSHHLHTHSHTSLTHPLTTYTHSHHLHSHSPTHSLTHTHHLHTYSLPTLTHITYTHSLTSYTHSHHLYTLTHSHTSLTHSLTHTHPSHISFCVAGAWLSALRWAWCTSLASLWRPLGSGPFAWQASDFLLCKGRDVRLWRPSGVPWAPGLLRGRRVTFCSARGVMYVSGVPLASLGLRAFCVAGAWLSALQGAWCTSLASLWRPLGSAPFAWQWGVP